MFIKGVYQVGEFNESKTTLDNNKGYLELKGEGLHITLLDLEEGKLAVEGFINCVEYLEGKLINNQKSVIKDFVDRIFK